MLLLFGSLIVLLIIGVPIAYSLGISSLIYFIFNEPLFISALPQRLFSGLDNYSLIALPMFIVMGLLMNAGGITARLIDFSLIFVGKLRGGLALVNIFASMIFGGISGSSTSDVASIGSILIPEMKKRGYSAKLAAGITVASSTMGMIIPPSIPVVLFAITAQESIGKLFLGGIIPGALVGITQLLLVFIIAYKKGYPIEKVDYSLRNISLQTYNAAPIMLLPIIVVGFVIFGIVTATESAVVGVLYSLILGLFLIRKLNKESIYHSFKEALITSAKIMLIIAFSQIYIWVLLLEDVPQQISTFLIELNLSAMALILFIALIVLIAGTVIDVSPAILLLTPVLMPTALAVGIDPIHFGIVLISALAIGACTPPVGNCLNVCSVVAKMKIGDIFQGAFPFLMANVIILILICIFPELITYIPNKIFMK